MSSASSGGLGQPYHSVMVVVAGEPDFRALGRPHVNAGGQERPRIIEAVVGRDSDLELLTFFLDGAATDGAALLITGEPGIGKTMLLDAAAELASDTGTRILRAAGVEFEADQDNLALEGACSVGDQVIS